MSKNKSQRLKLNNSGSTLVLAIIAIAFVSLLASVILAAAVGNVVMKRIDYNSKNTFYTAESVLDEIKVGVGKDSMVSMAGAYEEVLSNMIVSNGTLDYMLDNEEANNRLKALFMKDMTLKLTNGNVNFDTITDKLDDDTSITLENAKTYLSKYISKEELKYADIKSIESITFIKDYNGLKNQIILNNVVIDYKTKKTAETYFANVTVDLNVTYPNMMVDFSASKRLSDFKKFALVADKNINVNAVTSDIVANVQAGIYAGNNIYISSGTGGMGQLLIGSGIDADGNAVASNVVARNNIILKGSESGAGVPGKVAKLSVSASNLWCRNLETAKENTSFNKDITAGVNIDINSDCNTFIADDLNVSGKNSIINIGGNYYGYSYDGNDDAANHSSSSAIIVDGAGSVLNLGSATTTLKKLVLGGHSYIMYDGSNGYMTGESLSFTGDQELYLVPSKYISVSGSARGKQSVSNPMPTETWEKLKVQAADPANGITLVNMSGFFAQDEGLLQTAPYIEKNVGGMTYIYLNFKDKSSAAKYISGVLSGKAPELRDKLDKYTSGLLSDGVSSAGSVSIADGVTMYTAGVLMETNGGNVGLTYGGDVTLGELGIMSMDLKNRYKIMTQLLVPLPFEVNGSPYVVDDVERALEDLKEYYVTGSELDETTAATENIVDWDLVVNGYNDDFPTKEITGHAYGMPLTKVVMNGDYVVPDHIKGGVIVATGDVTVNGDFTGLIIAKGTIRIGANATIKTNQALVESLITYEYPFLDSSQVEKVPFRDFFDAYKRTGAEGSEEIKIESLGYDDIVSLDNWRKYDDSASAE